MRSRILSLATLALLLAACDSATDSGKAGPPARLDIVSGDAQQAVAGQELPQPLVVKVLDAKGKPVKGQIVNFRVVSGGGSVFAGAAVTNDDGMAQERWTLGKVVADSQRVEARAVDASTGNALVFGTFKATATAGTAAAVQPVGSTVLTAPLGSALDSLAARVVDANGNPVAGAQVSWVVTAGGGSLTPATATSNAAGVAKARFTLGAVVDSAQKAEARLGSSVAGFTVNTTIDMSLFDVTVSGDGQSGAPGAAPAQPVVVHVQLKDGRPVKGLLVNSIATNAQGNATLAVQFEPTAGSHAYVASLGDASHTIGSVTLHFTTVAALPSTIQLPRPTFWLAGAGVPSGTQLPIVFTLFDSSGNRTPGVEVTWQITAGNGTLSTLQSFADSLGQVKVTFTTGSAAYHEIKASIPGIGTRLFFVGTTPHTYTARIIPASPDTFRVAVGEQLNVQVEVRDETGAVYPNTPNLRWGWSLDSTPPGVLGFSGFTGYTQQYFPQKPGTAHIFANRIGTSCSNGTCPPDDIPGAVTPTRTIVVQ